MSDDATPGVELVGAYLRGQNLEQLGRVDEAIALYESALAAAFDSPGPYDRLIHVYSHRALHREVVRVAAAALVHVHTHDEKRQWYESMRARAQEAAAAVPRATPKKKP